jgi:hypothetical protein
MQTLIFQKLMPEIDHATGSRLQGLFLRETLGPQAFAYLQGLLGGFGRQKGEKGENAMTDRRRFAVIECRRINAETYHLTISGELWSEIEWSASRQCWCVQDAAGQCLAHTEHILEQDRDVQTAIRLARRMIVDGRMPTPEEARRQLHEKQERERLGEPMPILADRMPILKTEDK